MTRPGKSLVRIWSRAMSIFYDPRLPKIEFGRHLYVPMILAGITKLYSKYLSDYGCNIRDELSYTHLIPDIWNIIVGYARPNENLLTRLVGYACESDVTIRDEVNDYECRIAIDACLFNMEIRSAYGISGLITGFYPHVEVSLHDSRGYLARHREISVRTLFSMIFEYTPSVSGYELFRRSSGGEYLWDPIKNDTFRSNLCSVTAVVIQKFIDELIW